MDLVGWFGPCRGCGPCRQGHGSCRGFGPCRGGADLIWGCRPCGGVDLIGRGMDLGGLDLVGRGMNLVGDVDPIGGMDSPDSYILKIFYVKMKESGPLRGACVGQAP